MVTFHYFFVKIVFPNLKRVKTTLTRIGTIINYPNLEMNISYLIEQIFIVLISVLQDDGITRKYETRARWLIRRFILWKPPPVFIIYRRDFPKDIWIKIVSLYEKSPKTLDYVITRALEMIFDCIEETEEPIFNRNYYLLSIKRSKLLTWRFDKIEDQTADSDSKYDINYDCYINDGQIAEKGILDQNKDSMKKKNAIGVFN